VLGRIRAVRGNSYVLVGGRPKKIWYENFRFSDERWTKGGLTSYFFIPK